VGGMNKAEFFKQLEKNKIQPVYLFSGEKYYIALAIEKLKNKIFPDKNISSIETFYLDECEIEDVIKSIKNISLFSNRKMVIIKRVEVLTKGKIDEILPVVAEPPPNTFIIIVADSEIKDKSLSECIAKRFETVVKFPEYEKANELRGFIIEELEESGIKIEYDAIDLLLEFTGNSLFSIKNEIEKLKITYKDKKNILRADIEECVFADMKENL